jgi:hypothetical protein
VNALWEELQRIAETLQPFIADTVTWLNEQADAGPLLIGQHPLHG